LRGTLSLEAFFAHGLLEFLRGMAQRPRDALALLWFITRLHGKVRQLAVSDGGGPNEYGANYSEFVILARVRDTVRHARGKPVYGFDAAGLATSEEAMHAHRAVAGLARGVGGVQEPGPGPGNVAVGVVAQLECGGLCVRLSFEERAPGPRTFRECGGEEGGKRVREYGFHFRGVQHRLWGMIASGRRQNRSVREATNLEGVVENEYDYAVWKRDT